MVVAKTARTPTEAKLFAAMLEAEGIPAYVEGGSLSDEFAVSQKLMNVSGTKVKVREDHLTQAQDILTDVEIDDADLEAQALAAEPIDAPTEPPPKEPTGGMMVFVILAIVAIVIALAVRAFLL